MTPVPEVEVVMKNCSQEVMQTLKIFSFISTDLILRMSTKHSVKILKTCHAALQPGGKLLVIDAVILPGNEPSVGKMLDIEMLLIGGRERTEAEFRKLFLDSGFELTRIVPTPSPVSVVEGRRA